MAERAKKPAPAGAVPAWAPYRGAHAIDGACGVDMLMLADGDAEYAAAVRAVRDCDMTAVVMTAFPRTRFRYSDEAFAATKHDVADWTAKIARHPDLLTVVRSRADLERTRRERRLGVIFTFQGTEVIGEDLDRIAAFRELGVRVVQLTHNQRNLVGDGSLEPGDAGLSNFGHELVARLNAEKIVVDLAHGAARTTREGILASKHPVLISHSGCRALSDTPRLVADAELKLMADRGGVVGVILWPYLRAQGQQTAADAIRHIEHVIDVCGEDHVGIGSDLGIAPAAITPEFRQSNREMILGIIEQGIFTADRDPDLFLFPPDLNVANRLEVLAGQMSARGFKDARIEKIVGGNFARVMGKVWG